MTNLIAQLIVTLTLATNWTGTVKDGQELGYVVTNHVATVTYEGTSNVFTLKSVPGNVAVWRPAQTSGVLWLYPGPGAYITNMNVPGLGHYYGNSLLDCLNAPAHPLKVK